MSIDKKALRDVAEKATGAHDRLSVMPADDIFDISQHEGTQLDADIAAVNVFNEAANPDAVLAMLDELEAKEKRIAELEVKLETADKLQDSAFRHGLQHGFSLGQTDNQSGFEQAIQAYGRQWKGE
ncbi:ead/Ea22-like family protein [Siccibacter colletis]|uniref:ead/Ea22-like family protein n=1 Tax=Siccibacter colletis TaxID=1505757 RepID=UPI0004E203E9|nr:ead/Ea22-like family protein [Siccibacter colletis]